MELGLFRGVYSTAVSYLLVGAIDKKGNRRGNAKEERFLATVLEVLTAGINEKAFSYG
jgi:hypothetical protein